MLAALAGVCRIAPAPAQGLDTAALHSSTQLIVVTTPDWHATAGELRRFARADVGSPWQSVGNAVPIVVGRTGLAWGAGFDQMPQLTPAARGPLKREGDGRSPAGVFPIGSAFGFVPADSLPWLRLRYVQLTDTIECVDDARSSHYNEVLDRSAVENVDWQSSERMRRIAQYRLGFVVGYNADPPVPARGSCIFFHVWDGPDSATVGCTALAEDELASLLAWLDPHTQPRIVQLPAAVYAALRSGWTLP